MVINYCYFLLPEFQEIHFMAKYKGVFYLPIASHAGQCGPTGQCMHYSFFVRLLSNTL